jgi:hypothetical protein
LNEQDKTEEVRRRVASILQRVRDLSDVENYGGPAVRSFEIPEWLLRCDTDRVGIKLYMNASRLLTTSHLRSLAAGLVDIADLLDHARRNKKLPKETK